MAKKNNSSTTEEKNVPIVTILGHVDHGKTTILDKIRESNVQECETGGITQKISIFTINPDCKDEKKLTFIDTPGHEAFDLMRSRGGQIADIVILVIAADDGVMPQTKESIEIIKNSKAKPVIAINKTDLPNADVEKVKREIATEGLIPEDMGGEIPVVEVSGKTGKGLDELIEVINLVVEVEELRTKTNPQEKIVGKAFVLESVKDPSKGYVSSIVVVSGEIKKGSTIVFAGQKGNIETERVKGFVSEENEPIEKLETGYGGKLLGLSELLELGSEILAVDTNNKKDAAKLFKEEIKREKISEKVKEEEEDFWDSYFEEEEGTEKDDSKPEKTTLNVIIKSSSEGSLQAVDKAVQQLDKKFDNVELNILYQQVGEITQKDLEQAEISKAILLGFEVSTNSIATDLARNKKVLIRTYDLIYKLTEELEETMKMFEENEELEEELGKAEIRAIFTLSDGTQVLGGRVKEGIIKRNERCYILRGDDIIAEGRITSLKHQKDEINQAQTQADFGAVVSPEPENVEEGDFIVCFKIVK